MGQEAGMPKRPRSWDASLCNTLGLLLKRRDENYGTI
jgi:hypothetical protein